eukprot:Colp12_sorted_trinity150504_noHs@8368
MASFAAFNIIQRASRKQVLSAAGTALGVASAFASVPTQALCEEKDGDKPVEETPKPAQPSGPAIPSFDFSKIQAQLSEQGIKALHWAGPAAGAATVGSITGFCSGYALKKAGKAAAGTFGVLFIAMQAASWQGYITVNWNKVENDLMGLLDVNHDGKVDEKDVEIFSSKIITALTHNMGATAGGFTAGFFLGVARG